MPEISRFSGIVIRMYIDEHNPPHFHASYGSEEAEISIDRIEVIAGSLPLAILRKVNRWAELHRSELMNNWNNLRSERPTVRIKPLKDK